MAARPRPRQAPCSTASAPPALRSASRRYATASARDRPTFLLAWIRPSAYSAPPSLYPAPVAPPPWGR